MSERKCTAIKCLAARGEKPGSFIGGNFFSEDWEEQPSEAGQDRHAQQRETVFSSRQDSKNVVSRSGPVRRGQ